MPRKPTDLKAVIESRQRLDAIAQAHPELLNTHGASVDAWVDALKKDENDMSKVTAERQADSK